MDNAMRWMTQGWGFFMEHKVPLIYISFVSSIFSILSDVGLKSFLMTFFSTLIFTPAMMLGMAFVVVRLKRGESFSYGDILAPVLAAPADLLKVYRFYLFTFLWSLLLVIPGLIYAMRNGLFLYAHYDSEVDAENPFEASIEMTEGHLWSLFLSSFIPACIFIGVLVPLAFVGAFKGGESPLWTKLVISIVGNVLVTPWIMGIIVCAYDELAQNVNAQAISVFE